MTTSSRFERELPAILEDLYLGPSPDYRNEVLATATRPRQRPAWTFPGRWLPMADIASRPAFLPRLPLRTIAAGLVITALLLAVAAVYLGSRQTKLPPPFGVARNGLVVYTANGDIFASDPVTGATTAIVSGPEIDGNPRFSRDGTRVAFMRQSALGGDRFDLVVARADGSDLKVLTAAPLHTDSPYEWSPDGSYLLFTDPESRVFRADVTGSTQPVLVKERAYVQAGELRPPDGRQILFEPVDIEGHALWVMNADGTGARQLYTIPPEEARDGDFGSVRYSPDGTKIAFLRAPAGDTVQLRIFVMNADGSEVRQLTSERGVWTETDFAWSPDGTRIAFDRWLQDQTTLDWLIQPIGIMSVDGGGGVTPIGPVPVSDGAWFDYSPDGAMLISRPGTNLGSPTLNVQPIAIDVSTGRVSQLDWQVGSVMTWQRLAE